MKNTLWIFALLALVLAAGCSDEVQQYSIEQFMETERISGGAFSADEKRVLLSSDRTGVFNAFSIPVKGGEAERLTDSEDNAVYVLSCFPEGNSFLFLSDSGGNEIFHIYMQDGEGNTRDLTPWENARSIFYRWSHNDSLIIFGSNRRDSRFMDLYTMDIESFEPKMLYVNDAGLDFGAISNDMRYIAFSKQNTRNDIDIYLYDRRTGEVELITEGEGEVRNTPSGFGTDSRKLFYLTDEGSEFIYLKSYHIPSGRTETVEKADWDISYSFLSRNGRYRVTAINRDGRTDIRVRDRDKGEQVSLPDLPEGVISSVGISRSEKLMRFCVTGSTSPENLYIYNLANGVYRRLTDTMNPEIERDDLVEAEVVRYESFDGLKIPAILYMPAGADDGNRVPGLVLVHGGPGGQSRVGYNTVVQYLANHGYAVLAVNNRGSSGYGKSFYKLDDRRHGRDDLGDCIEGKRFLVETGKVIPERVGIMGGSYGGYMVLAALSFRPDEFAAGVDIFGVSNWLRTLRSIPAWWESYRKSLYREIGDPEVDEEYLREISPLFHAENIRKPLMVLQGANDPRVLKVESDEIVRAVRENGVAVRYLVFEDEGHGFRKKENRIEGYGEVLKFLDRHLKGTGEESQG